MNTFLFHRRSKKKKKFIRVCTKIGIVFVFVSDSIVYYVYAHKLPFPTPVAFSLCVVRNVNSLRHLPRTNFPSGHDARERERGKKEKRSDFVCALLLRFVSFGRFGALFADGGEYIRGRMERNGGGCVAGNPAMGSFVMFEIINGFAQAFDSSISESGRTENTFGGMKDNGDAARTGNVSIRATFTARYSPVHRE